MNDPEGRLGLGVVWGDYDNDGWPDLFVGNDTEPSYLYRNKHDGTFEDQALLSGAAVSAEGKAMGSMGVDFGDFDRDGKLDITVGTFAYQPDNLFHNQRRRIQRHHLGCQAWAADLPLGEVGHWLR